ncbi:MAG: hypothetical protein ACK5JC_01595 [Bacteroidota bacterium]
MKAYPLILKILFLTLLTTFSFAQTSKLVLDGLISDEESGDPIYNAKVELLENDQVTHVAYTPASGKFLFDVPPDKQLVIRCSKDNYVAKKITVITDGIASKPGQEEVFKFPINVRLFREMPDLDVSVLQSPIGSIFYLPSKGIFDYTVDRDLKKKIEKLQEEVEKKIKEKQKDEEKLKKQVKKGEEKAREKEALAKKEEEKMRAKERQAKKDQEKAQEKEAKPAAHLRNVKKNKSKEAEKRNENNPKPVEIESSDSPKRATLRLIPEPPPHPPISNVSQNFREESNHTILTTTCIFDINFMELSKISFIWGGRYYKRNKRDVTSPTYYKLMDMIQPEGNEYDKEAPIHPKAQD